MTPPKVDEGTLQEVRSELEARPGIRRAIVEGPPWKLHLICNPGANESAPIEAEARAILHRSGVPSGELELEVSYVTEPQPRRRVRFVDVEIREVRAAIGRGTVSLEWGGHVAAGEAEGANTPSGEVRIAAEAALRALEAVIRGAISFHLVGVKAMRVFDSDLIVVLVRASSGEGASLVGAALVAEAPTRAAVLAVLNATNRLLGNYLHVSD